MNPASTLANGYLTAANFIVFNNKVSATRTINTTSPLQGGGDLSANRTLTIAQSAIGVDGYLSGADFGSFSTRVTTAINLLASGNAVSIFKQKNGSNELEIRKLVEGTNIVLTETAEGIIIDCTASGGSGADGNNFTTSFTYGSGQFTMGRTGLANLTLPFTKTTIGLGNVPDVDMTNLSNATSGTLAAARFGALTGDVTTPSGSYATTIANSAVTFAKFQNITSQKLTGRYALTNGVMQEITLGTGLSLNSSTGVLDVTVAGGSSATYGNLF